jgi:hypothetical protein
MVFGPVADQYIMTGAYGRGGCLFHGSLETNIERKEARVTISSSRVHTQ